MTAANFSLAPDIVVPDEPDFTTIISQSEGMKKQYQSLTDTPTQRYKLYFKAISNTDFWTIYNHYYSCKGPWDSFSWISVPDYIDCFTNDTSVSLTTVGSDLITNGGFDTDTTGWTAYQSTLASIAGGQAGNCLELTRSSGTSQIAYQGGLTLVQGKLYRCQVYVKSGTSGNEAFIISSGAVVPEAGNLLLIDALGGGYLLIDGTGAKLLIDEPAAVGSSIYSKSKTGTSSASWVQQSLIFMAETAMDTIALTKNTATAGTMLFDTVTLYNVTQSMTGRWVKGSLNFTPLSKLRWNVEISFEKAV